jgi:hypothetical protein
MPVEERPAIFVASEFFAKEPLRVAREAMLRERRAYEHLFAKPVVERSAVELDAGERRVLPCPFQQLGQPWRLPRSWCDLVPGAELVRGTAWFARCFAPLRAQATSAAEQAADLARVAVLVTIEPGSTAADEPLCRRGELCAFHVVVAGAVRVAATALADAHERAEGEWIGRECLAPLKDGIPASTAAADILPATGRGTLTLLRISIEDHRSALGLQRQRQYRTYADVLARLPMLKHYSCAQRTALANSFEHVTFPTDHVVRVR